MNATPNTFELPATFPGPNGGPNPCPTVMTEEELIRFLRYSRLSNQILNSLR
jgi:hypothetical protein